MGVLGFDRRSSRVRRTVRTPITMYALAALIAAFLCSVSTALYAQVAPTVWPMFHADLRHTGLSTVDTSGNPGNLKWLVLMTEQLDPSPAIGVGSSPAIGADGTIYVGGDQELFAVNPDGVVKWRFLTKSLIGLSSPAIGADGTIYIGSFDRNLYALSDGGPGIVNQKWAFAAEDVINTSPTIGQDGTIYIGSWDGNLYAINPDGSLKWKFATGQNYTSSAAIGPDGTIYIGSFDQNLYAITDGGQGIVSKKWAFSTGDTVYTSPAIGGDGTIYFGSSDHNLYALTDGGSGAVQKKWSFQTGEAVASSPAIGPDGTIYFGSNDRGLYALTDSGTSVRAKWALDIGGAFSSPAVGADGTIFIGSFDNHVYAVTDNGASASVKWAFPTGFWVRSSPAIAADGTIYAGSDDNHLYALGTSDPSVPVTLRISTRSLDFGDVKSGKVSRTRYVVLENPVGGRKKPALTVSIQGQQLAPAFLPFSVGNGCTPTLDSRQKCRIAVVFAPDQKGPVSGNLLIYDNAQRAPQIVKLKGRGT